MKKNLEKIKNKVMHHLEGDIKDFDKEKKEDKELIRSLRNKDGKKKSSSSKKKKKK